MVRGRLPVLTREEAKDGARPKTRGDCEEGPRPCPWRECRYHLGSDIPESCALDVADRGPHTSEQVAKYLGITRQGAEWIEKKAIAKARKKGLPSV